MTKKSKIKKRIAFVQVTPNMYRFVLIHAQRITTGYSKGKLGWKIMGTLVLGRYNGNWENNEPAR